MQSWQLTDRDAEEMRADAASALRRADFQTAILTPVRSPEDNVELLWVLVRAVSELFPAAAPNRTPTRGGTFLL
jgi:hypothetical protein